mgnify:FL=1
MAEGLVSGVTGVKCDEGGNVAQHLIIGSQAVEGRKKEKRRKIQKGLVQGMA